MNRSLIWAMVFAAGVIFGLQFGGHRQTVAEVPEDDAAAERRDEEIVEQLKRVNTQLKELNTMFRSGTARVVEVINPDKP